jgi:HSP20 family protein
MSAEEEDHMKMIRWNPAFDLLSVHSELDRVFNDLVSGTGFNPRYAGDGTPVAFLPLDVRRADGKIVVEASVPGFSPEQVSVTIDGGILTVAASRDEEREAGGEYMRRERHTGRVYRQISLGEEVDGEKADAAFKDGVLTVTIPLVTRPEPRRIPINGATD